MARSDAMVKQRMAAVPLFAFTVFIFSVPSPAYAATTGYDLFDVVRVIFDLARITTPIVAALALLAFFWGLTMYTGVPIHYFGEGEHKRKTEGKTIMFWGIVVLFVALSVFGIVAALQDTFLLQDQSLPVPSATPQGRVGPGL